jgi:hypothetical protein
MGGAKIVPRRLKTKGNQKKISTKADFYKNHLGPL